MPNNKGKINIGWETEKSLKCIISDKAVTSYHHSAMWEIFSPEIAESRFQTSL